MRQFADSDPYHFDLYVRGSVPKMLEGALIVASSRRNKDRSVFSRWHDSQADLFRIDLSPGKPGRIRAHLLTVDPHGKDIGVSNPYCYLTQPNHGINIEGNSVWATNLLFGAPLEIDLKRWKPRRVLRYVETDSARPQLSGSSHFAWSLDHRYAYFHQSLLEREADGKEVRATRLCLIEMDTKTREERVWEIAPPLDDSSLETANFHSAFYFEEAGRGYVGLLRTGARLETLAPHKDAADHVVRPMPASTVWIVEINRAASKLQATTLPGIAQLGGLALSHLDVDASGGNGFVLFANYKQADVAEETHGKNIYGENAEAVREHYSGMTVEALNYGMVMRYERRDGATSLRTFSRPYDPSNTSQGHSWLPINIELDDAGEHLFCTFSGFRPRLLPKHVAKAYPKLTVKPSAIRYVPPLLLRFNASTLEVDRDSKRRHLSYAEPIAMTVVGSKAEGYVCTFSPEVGLRIYPADDLSAMVCHAVAPEFMNWGETHFRPDPAHMQFTRR
jgi:hypothetical protein